LCGISGKMIAKLSHSKAVNRGYDGDSMLTSIHCHEMMNLRYIEHGRMGFAKYSIEMSISTNCSNFINSNNRNSGLLSRCSYYIRHSIWYLYLFFFSPKR
jgi:hypothetical protein